MNSKIGIYNAGALFSEAEQNQRKLEGKLMRTAFGTRLNVHNPIDTDINDQEELTNKKIFEFDYSLMNKSKYFVFDIDSKDTGTFIEFGMAFQKAMVDPNIYIICNYSDFRIKGEYKVGNWPSYSMNAFVHGACYHEKLISSFPRQIYITTSTQESIELIGLIESGNKFDDCKYVNYLNWPVGNKGGK